MNYTYCTNDHWLWLWPGGFFIIIILFFVVGRFWLWGGRSHYKDWHGRAGNDHISILKQRYAAGEITKAEFDKIKKDLSE